MFWVSQLGQGWTTTHTYLVILSAVRLVKVDADVDLTHPERQVSFYIDVTDLDKVYETMQPELANLPEGRVRAPFDQAYGHREFHVADEDCTFILFGEAIH